MRLHISPSHIPVKIIQIDVRQQRGKDSALRCACCRLIVQIPFNIPGFQHLADDFQHPFIMDAHSPYFLKQYPMADVVKTPLNVTFHCPHSLVGGFTPGVDYIDNIPDCVLLRPVRAKAVAVRIKSRLAYRLYD